MELHAQHLPGPTALSGNRGIILATNSSLSKGPIALPMVFDSHELAIQFLSACERTGVELYPAMAYSEMRKLFALWHDSYKRPTPSPETWDDIITP